MVPRANGDSTIEPPRRQALLQPVRSGRVERMRSLLLLALLAAAPASAQCPGDCNGDGVVRVEEMIVGVRIALGEDLIAACPAFDVSGEGEVGINELVLAVTSLLNGCPATPTPAASPTAPDTPTASPTATDTAMPTATPTIPPVGGEWTEAALTIDDSTCPEPLTAAFAEELTARGACTQEVEITGEETVRVTDCSDQVVDGTLERDGTLRLTFPPTEGGVEGCTLTLSTTSVIPAGSPPVLASYAFAIAFEENCGLDDCTIAASGAWTR